jgi:hypothetical protein
MATEVDTKDCTALSDAELAEMADLCVDGPAHLDIGVISKQVDEWVLISQVRIDGKLWAFGFCTLERIGGTPSLLIGLASVKRGAKRSTALKAMITDQFRRAVLAFPDEDVVIGTRMADAGAFEAYKTLEDVIPRPGYKATGEERAWGRRLAKRFGVEKSYDDRTFTVTGGDNPALGLDYEALASEKINKDVAAQFDHLDVKRGDCLVTFGWAMAEDLAALGD